MGWWKNLQNTLHPPPARPAQSSEPFLLNPLSNPPPPPRSAGNPLLHPGTLNAVHHLIYRHFRLILLLLFATTTLLLLHSFTSMKAAPAKLYEAHDAGAYAAWVRFEKLPAYFAGVDTIVPVAEHTPEYPRIKKNSSAEAGGEGKKKQPKKKKRESREFNPYPDYAGEEYKRKWPGEYVECGFGERERPEVRVYDGVPQGMPDAVLGSAEVLGLENGVCFERYGRLGAYGYGYKSSEGGLGVAVPSFKSVLHQKINYNGVNWGELQRNCTLSNAARFAKHTPPKLDLFPSALPPPRVKRTPEPKYRPRTAVILRTYTGYKYTPDDIASLRALISELALLSGGEYHVQILIHVKDPYIPIFTSAAVYRRTLETSGLPKEFWGLAELWNVPLMQTIYSPVVDTSAEFKHSRLTADELFKAIPVHEAYRSTFMPVQYWALRNPQFDFVWNWEMDVRYTGHWYHLFSKLDDFTTAQKREHLAARNAEFYIPALHGEYSSFLGADRAEGASEPADLVTLNPVFTPDNTTWILRDDYTGYKSPPKRKAAIITTVRLSRKLLMAMHDENLAGRTMFSEMWPASVANTHGMKTVYAPHPVWVDRRWPMAWLDKLYNEKGRKAPWGRKEGMFEGTSWFYNAKFAGRVYRRWAGLQELDRKEKDDERMCLRGGWLHHPVKTE